MIEPIYVKPFTVLKPWAGSKLKTVLNKDVSIGTGETWEFSNESIVINGTFEGMTLEQVFKEHSDLFGFDHLPILTKFIDAKDWLSIQVHPNDEQAKLLENLDNGKTEAWYFIDTDENSKVINGCTNICNDSIVTTQVYKDSYMSIPAGTVHAIGPGILLYEVQQYSDITYRLYDWHRTDREIHVEKGNTVRNCNVSDINRLTEDIQIIHNNDYFITYSYIIDRELELNNDMFNVLVVVSGDIILIIDKEYDCSIGQTVIIPICNRYKLTGNGHVLITEAKTTL